MARVPYQRVRSRPPYVARKSDDVLLRAADRPETVLVVSGGGARRGVSRTLHQFVRRAPTTNFLGGKNRYPIVFDFIPHSFLPLPEHLVVMRNLVVGAFNRTFGVTAVGSYFFEFDAAYRLWLKLEEIDASDATALTPTKRAKVAKGVAKLVVTISTAGTFEIVGPLKHIAELAKTYGWGAAASFDAARDKMVERTFEARLHNLQVLVHGVIAPRISKRIKAAKADDALMPADLAWIMQELFVVAMARAQRDIGEKGIMLLAADAIDEIADDHDEDDGHNQLARTVFAGVLQACAGRDISAIVCGRRAGPRWFEELELQGFKEEDIGLLSKHDIGVRLEQAGLEPATIQTILDALGDKQAVVAGDFESACRRLVKTWPNG